MWAKVLVFRVSTNDVYSGHSVHTKVRQVRTKDWLQRGPRASLPSPRALIIIRIFCFCFSALLSPIQHGVRAHQGGRARESS